MAKYLEDIRVLGGTVSIGSLTSSNTDNLFEVDGDSAVIGSLAVGTYSNTPGYVFDARGDINIGKNGVNTLVSFLGPNVDLYGASANYINIRTGYRISLFTYATPIAQLDTSQSIFYGNIVGNNNISCSATVSTTGLKITSGASNGYILQSDASGNATWESTLRTLTTSSGSYSITLDDNVLVGTPNGGYHTFSLPDSAPPGTEFTIIKQQGGTISILKSTDASMAKDNGGGLLVFNWNPSTYGRLEIIRMTGFWLLSE
jgi:hypothetical protein